MRRQFPLRWRMVLVSSAALILCLTGVGFVLDGAFRDAAERSVRERMLLHVYTLLGVSEIVDHQLLLPAELPEPQFNMLGSGLYAVVTARDGTELWRSHSAMALQVTADTLKTQGSLLQTGEVAFGRTGVARESLFYLGYQVLWESGPSQRDALNIFIFEHHLPFANQLATFRRSLLSGLGIVVLLLVLVQVVAFRWSIAPLTRVAAEVKRIEMGQQDHITGHYPGEIAALSSNLNLLMASERERRERYRRTLADLAHSLKTPLAILQGVAATSSSDESSAREISEQVTRMNDIVSYQLEKAASAGAALTRTLTKVAPLLAQLRTTLTKVYPDCGITLDIADEQLAVRMDERDFVELFGNLMENACKFAGSKVSVLAGERNGTIVIEVRDDGPGIAAEQRDRVVGRGARLDQSVPGQGIGLAVVCEIVDRYQGNFEISDASDGGSRVVVTL